MTEAAYADIEIDQGADFALQVIWTDVINEAYRVVHPMRLQARAATGQVLLDLSSLDQSAETPQAVTPTLVYSTEGGVVQVIIPSSITEQLPVGELYYDLFVSYTSTSSSFLTGDQSTSVRRAKLLTGKIIVEGRVTKHV